MRALSRPLSAEQIAEELLRDYPATHGVFRVRVERL